MSETMNRNMAVNSSPYRQLRGYSFPQIEFETPLSSLRENGFSGDASSEKKDKKKKKCQKCCCFPLYLIFLFYRYYKRKFMVINHRMTHYSEDYRYLPYLFALVFILCDLPFFLKNVVYYRSSIDEAEVYLVIFDVFLGVFVLLLVGIFGYIGAICCVKRFKKKHAWMRVAILTAFVFFLSILLGVKRGTNVMIAQHVYEFDERDPYIELDPLPQILVWFLIPPIDGLTSGILFLVAIFFHIILSDDTMGYYVRYFSEMGIVVFFKYYEMKNYENDMKYFIGVRKLQDQAIKAKHMTLETLRYVVPSIRLLLLFQHSGEDKIFLHHVYVVQAQIIERDFTTPPVSSPRSLEEPDFDQGSTIDLTIDTSKSRTIQYYENYLVCSDNFDCIARRYNMFRIHEEKERLVYISYTQQHCDLNVLFACAAALEMRGMFKTTPDVQASFDMFFLVATGSVSMGMDIINNSKIRFMSAFHTLRFILESMASHPIVEVGDVYSLQEMVLQPNIENEVFNIEVFSDQELSLYNQQDEFRFKMCRIKGFVNLAKLQKELMNSKNGTHELNHTRDRRNSIDVIRVKKDQDESKEEDEDDNDFSRRTKNNNKKKKKKKKTKGKDDSFQDDWGLDVRREEDRTLFRQKKITKGFKNKKMEQRYRNWFRIRSLDVTRIMFCVFLFMFIKVLLSSSMIGDHVFFCPSLFIFQLTVLTLMLIVMALIFQSDDMRRKVLIDINNKNNNNTKKRGGGGKRKRRKKSSATSSISYSTQFQRQRSRKCPFIFRCLCFCCLFRNKVMILNRYTLFLLLDCLFGVSWLLIPILTNDGGSNSHRFVPYINIDFYISCFLIMKTFPVVPLHSQFLFVIIRIILWVTSRSCMISKDTMNEHPEFLAFTFLVCFSTIYFLFINFCQRLAFVKSSRELFKYAFRVKRMSSYLNNSRVLNRMIILNSIPSYHKIQSFIEEHQEEESEEPNLFLSSSTSSKLSSSHEEEQAELTRTDFDSDGESQGSSNDDDDEEEEEEKEGDRETKITPLFFNRCNIMMIEFEWINEDYGKEEKIAQKLLKIADLNERFEMLLEDKKEKTGMERLQFNEKYCVVIQYSCWEICDLLSLSLDIRNKIVMLFPDLYARICITTDPCPSIGKFMGGMRSDLFSERFTNIRIAMSAISNSPYFRNRILVCGIPKRIHDKKIRGKFKFKNCEVFVPNLHYSFSSQNHGGSVRELVQKEDEITLRLDSSKKKRSLEKKDSKLINRKGSVSSDRRRFFNLKINNFLPTE